MLKMKFIAAAVMLTAVLVQAQESPLVIRLVRHGQPGVGDTDFTPEDKAAWIVLGLTALGRKQAETLGKTVGKELRSWQADSIVIEGESGSVSCGSLFDQCGFIFLFCGTG